VLQAQRAGIELALQRERDNLQHETDVTIPIETEALKNEGRALVDKGGSMLGWMPSTASLD
jgi:hypothetical protein